MVGAARIHSILPPDQADDAHRTMAQGGVATSYREHFLEATLMPL
jgi:hypothetical protein